MKLDETNVHFVSHRIFFHSVFNYVVAIIRKCVPRTLFRRIGETANVTHLALCRLLRAIIQSCAQCSDLQFPLVERKPACHSCDYSRSIIRHDLFQDLGPLPLPGRNDLIPAGSLFLFPRVTSPNRLSSNSSATRLEA